MTENKPKSAKRRSSTMAALLEEKPRRGRPPRAVSRQNVYVALSKEHKATLDDLTDHLPDGVVRADLPDLAISILTARLEALRHAVADRDREIPEGITDLESLYLLWDLPLPEKTAEERWTSIRLSPQQSIELGRAHGTLNAVFGSNRSDTFQLALALFANYVRQEAASLPDSPSEIRKKLFDTYL